MITTWSVKVIVGGLINEIMSLRLAEEMIFSLCARGCANRVGFYTIPYIRVHILGVGSANVRKRHHPMPERISSCTRSPRMWWPLDGSIFTSYPYDLVLLHLFLSGNIFHDLISYEYWIWESAGQGDESVNLHHMVDTIWMLTSHV